MPPGFPKFSRNPMSGKACGGRDGIVPQLTSPGKFGILYGTACASGRLRPGGESVCAEGAAPRRRERQSQESDEERHAEGRGPSGGRLLFHSLALPVGQPPDRAGDPGADPAPVRRDGLHQKLRGPLHGHAEDGADRPGGALYRQSVHGRTGVPRGDERPGAGL